MVGYTLPCDGTVEPARSLPGHSGGITDHGAHCTSFIISVSPAHYSTLAGLVYFAVTS